LDLAKITLNGQEVISNGGLANNILTSNLQRVGQLQELQVSGESLLSGSLYTTNRRVGVNTIEPNAALSVWDQEIEINFGKQTNGVGVIESTRNYALVLSSNSKNNLRLETDGSVSLGKLNLGLINISASVQPPADTQPKGSIVFNANPSMGGPMGWVSLGDAKWANFGIID